MSVNYQSFSIWTYDWKLCRVEVNQDYSNVNIMNNHKLIKFDNLFHKQSLISNEHQTSLCLDVHCIVHYSLISIS
jgi:hypothetical protein